MAIVKMIFDDRDVPMTWHEVESYQIIFGQEQGTASIKSYSNGRTRYKETQAKGDGNSSADYSISRVSVPLTFNGELTLANIEKALLSTDYFKGGERQVYNPNSGRGEKVE